MELEQLNNISKTLFEIRTKLSMADSTMQIRNSRFYLPNYPRDIIQKVIAESSNYWDTAALDLIDYYLKDRSVILDVGANIGNHSIYWAVERQAKKIYAFEPLVSTFEILQKNIELNGLEKVITAYNFGLSDKKSKAVVGNFCAENIGGTSFIPSKDGNFQLKKLDSVKISEKIDLIKIDVEGAEVEMLLGAEKTINRDKPLIVIETFTHFDKVDEILSSWGYKLIQIIRENEDYIYKYFEE